MNEFTPNWFTPHWVEVKRRKRLYKDGSRFIKMEAEIENIKNALDDHWRSEQAKDDDRQKLIDAIHRYYWQIERLWKNCRITFYPNQNLNGIEHYIANGCNNDSRKEIEKHMEALAGGEENRDG
jgi:hypothetical protein